MNKPTNSMYKYIPSKINNDIIKYHFKNPDSSILNYSDFIRNLSSEDNDFLKVLIEALNDATSRLSAYFWECVPITNNSINKPFEFAVTKSVDLDNIRQNFSSFEKIIVESHDENVCNFLSLGRDAMLIIPIPQNLLDYKNISNFTKNAPIKQQCLFWKRVADELTEFLKIKRLLWLSTNGLGVHYLHVRIDVKPKYYSYREYWKIEKNNETCQKNKKNYNDTSKIKQNSSDHDEKVKENKKDYGDTSEVKQNSSDHDEKVKENKKDYNDTSEIKQNSSDHDEKVKENKKDYGDTSEVKQNSSDHDEKVKENKKDYGDTSEVKQNSSDHDEKVKENKKDYDETSEQNSKG